jgi:hypothetical protein
MTHPPWHPGPDCGCWSCLRVRRNQRKAARPSSAPDACLAVSIVWGILAGIVWAGTDSAANTCKNALVGALAGSQCTTVTFWHDMASFSVAAGIIGIIFAGLAMRKR